MSKKKLKVNIFNLFQKKICKLNNLKIKPVREIQTLQIDVGTMTNKDNDFFANPSH